MTIFQISALTPYLSLADLLILLISTVIFVRFVVRTTGILKAARSGSLIDASIAQARQDLSKLVSSLAIKIDGQAQRVLELTSSAEKLSKAISPAGVQKAIEARAQEIASYRIDTAMSAIQQADRYIKSLECLITGMTGPSNELAEFVRSGLPELLPPEIVGRLKTYCGQRNVRIGVSPSSYREQSRDR